MTTTTFVDNSTVVSASWLNDVDTAAYKTLTSVAGTNTITATGPANATLAAGLAFEFIAAGANTGAVTLNVTPSGGAALGAKSVTKFGTTALVTGDIVSGGAYRVIYDGTRFVLLNPGIVPAANTSGLAASGANTDITSLATVTTTTQSAGDNSTKLATTAYADRAVALRGYIDGYVMSTAGSSATMTIGAGSASDSTGAVILSRSSSISKTTSAWAVGTAAGGLDTGAIANNTTYHFYAIRRPDTGVVDVLFSLSASSPTLPTNYTQFRRIGSGRTNGSAQWVKFVQDGDYFMLDTPVLDIDVTNPGAAAVTRTLASLPTGIRVGAIFNYGAYDPTNANQVLAYFSDLSLSDQSPSSSSAPLASSISAATSFTGGLNKLEVMTNTSAQIRSRVAGNPAVSSTLVLKIATLGWRDTRGRDA